MGSGVVQAGGQTCALQPGDVEYGDVVQADGDNAGNSSNRVVGFLSSFRENVSGAKKLYREGDAVFRQAKQLDRDKAPRSYAKAANLFKKAGSSAPGSALEQDALFMQAESHFFANELTQATKTYQTLQKDFPRNRHSDRIAARLFSISKYWIDASRAGADEWYKINFFDDSRPAYDSQGEAIRVLDQIRYDDPTGRLADDATMAAAAEHIRQQDFEKADEFLTDLRTAFTDSDHMFMAHLLGIESKLRIYAGPDYSGLVLEEAKTLIQQTRERFPDRLKEQKYADQVARAAAKVTFLQAERLANRAKYREKREEYGAATKYYQQILRDHPSTPQAKIARARIGDTQKYQAVPDQPLAWLTKVFPDSKKSTPLETVESKRAPAKESSGTMLR